MDKNLKEHGSADAERATWWLVITKMPDKFDVTAVVVLSLSQNK